MRRATEITLSVQGLTLRAKHWPGATANAPRLLALHGWLDNAASFVPLAAHLADWDLVAVDLPGHGLSAHRSSDATYHFVDWVGTIVAVLDSLGWARAVLMGHSMGAGAAALVAGTLPTRVAGLVLLDALAPYTAVEAAMPERLAAYLQEVQLRPHRPLRPYANLAAASRALCRVVAHLSEANAALLVERNTRPLDDGQGVGWRSDPRLRGTSALTLTEPQLHAFLRRIVCPSVFIQAPDGLAWEPHALQRNAACFAQLTTVTIAGGHHVHMQRAADVAAAIRPCLTACEAAARPGAAAT
jgi:pimeloyl-ACP methyl ester carboxylesterase